MVHHTTIAILERTLEAMDSHQIVKHSFNIGVNP